MIIMSQMMNFVILSIAMIMMISNNSDLKQKIFFSQTGLLLKLKMEISTLSTFITDTEERCYYDLLPLLRENDF